MATCTCKPPLAVKLLDILVIWIPYKPKGMCYIHLKGISRYFGTNYKISYNMHYFAILSKPTMFCQSCPITNGLVPLEIHSMFVSV